MANEAGDNLANLCHERRILKLKERNQTDFQVDEAFVSNQESSDRMQQLEMGGVNKNWDVPIYHEGSELAISKSDNMLYVESDISRRMTVDRVLDVVIEEPGPAAPALPPITDPNIPTFCLYYNKCRLRTSP